MAREEGTFPFAANFERKKSGMIDATQFVPQFSDLLLFTGDNYIANGFPVCVATTTTYNSDEKKSGWYQCVDPNNLNLEASWKYLGGVNFNGTNGKIPKFNSDGSIEDSNLQEIGGKQWLFGTYLNLLTTALTASRNISFPDKSGVFALLSDIIQPSTSGKNNYLENTLYDTVDEIIYIILNGKTQFYKVLQSFTSANTGTIEDSLSNDISGGNLELVEVGGLTLQVYDAELLYPQYAQRS